MADPISLDNYFFICYNSKSNFLLYGLPLVDMYKFFSVFILSTLLFFFLTDIEAEEMLKVGKIGFEGNKTFSDKLLRRFVGLESGKQFDEFFAKMGKSRLENFYKSQGFLDVNIKWERRLVGNKVDNTIHIDEGRRAVVDTIIYKGNTVFGYKDLSSISYIEPGDFLVQSDIFNTRYNILKEYSKRGYIRATVVSDTLQDRKYHYILVYDIVEGRPVYIRDIKIRGNQRVRKELIRRKFKLKNGDLYNPEKVNDTQAGIYSTGLFESVKYDITEYPSGDTVDLIFQVKERAPRSITFGTGYVYSDKNPNRLSIRTGWRHNNIWGNAQRLGIYPQVETDFYNYHKGRVEISYEEPYLLNTAFQGGSDLFFEREKREDTRQDIIGASINIGRYLGRYTQAALIYRYEDVVTRNLDVTERWISSISISILYDRKDDIFYPTKGVVSLINHEYAGGIIGGDVDYQKMVIENVFYKKLPLAVWAVRLKGGYIWDDRNMPYQEKFSIGGMGSVRGYDQEAIGPLVDGMRRSRVMVVANTELRLAIFRSIELAYFIDAGGLWNILNDISLTENTGVSAGVGVGYRSPIGPIRLDYAHRLKGPSGGNIYLTIGYMF